MKQETFEFEIGDLVEIKQSVFHNHCGDLCIIVEHIYYPESDTWYWLTYNQLSGHYVDMLPSEMKKV